MGHRWGFVPSKMASVLTASIQECDVYYLCGQGEFGEMITCDSPGCPLTWFHMECAGIHIEKNHRRSSKRGRKHRRQTGRVELNSTFPVCRRQGPGQPAMPAACLRQTFTYAGEYRRWQRRPCRRHVCAICELGFNSSIPSMAPGVIVFKETAIFKKYPEVSGNERHMIFSW